MDWWNTFKKNERPNFSNISFDCAYIKKIKKIRHLVWQGFHKDTEETYQRNWIRWLILADENDVFTYKTSEFTYLSSFCCPFDEICVMWRFIYWRVLWYLQYTIIKTTPVITSTSYDKITRWISYCKQGNSSTDTGYHKHDGVVQILLTCFRNVQWISQQQQIFFFISGFSIFPKIVLHVFLLYFLPCCNRSCSEIVCILVFYPIHVHNTIEIYLTRG